MSQNDSLFSVHSTSHSVSDAAAVTATLQKVWEDTGKDWKIGFDVKNCMATDHAFLKKGFYFKKHKISGNLEGKHALMGNQ